ncbi:UNVERIFIED_CONTAM: hypothetical protein K2H54_002652 [Gekko kuhli]
MDLESICHEFCGEANELRQEMQNMMLGLPGVIMDAIQQEFRNGEQARYGGVLAPHISLQPFCSSSPASLVLHSSLDCFSYVAGVYDGRAAGFAAGLATATHHSQWGAEAQVPLESD